MIVAVVRVITGSGIPAPEFFRAVVERVMADDGIGVSYNRLEGGPRLSKDPTVAAAEVTEAWSTKRFQGPFVESKVDELFFYPDFVKSKRRTSSAIHLQVPYEPGAMAVLDRLMVDLVEMCSAHYGFITLNDSDKGVNERGVGFDERAFDMCEVSRVERPQDGRGCGSHMGLAGVAQRLVLGQLFVDLLGAGRLEALDPAQGSAVGDGLWMLSSTPVDEFEQWNVDRYCDGEAAIIEALGPEYFYEPLTKRLPEKRPEVDELAPFAVKLYDPWEQVYSDI